MADPKNHLDNFEPTVVASSTNSTDMEKGPVEQPPVTRWDRFELTRFIGQGGMGRVFQGFDFRLNRQVAVKFLLESNPQKVARFVREARAQARVEHEHICKVYEVGEVEGHPYIAMQFISGEPLKIATASMTLEEKLQIMKKVAQGVHEANRVGLVHRDLKPANIMVEQGEDGSLKPYVLDFGLARFGSEVDLTMDGTILGTPGYMAPEQVLGDIGMFDRRTDVYGLGATLYHLLTDEPPFTGSSQIKVFKDILEKDPEKLRQKKSGIPLDVETIALKCLEKRPENRYESANALADDLSHYLNGDPIKARPTSFWYRFKKKARKNQLAFSLGTVASLLLLLTFSWGLHTTWQASIRERLARETTAQVKEIEALARVSHMSPRHDIRPDRARLLDRMQHIQDSLSKAGKQGKGPSHFALGSGYLALNDLASARHHLDIAWAEGYRDSRVAYALGLTYSELFRENLAQIQLIADEHAREKRRAILASTYRDPALTFMKRAKALEMAAPAYIEALIAYCENRFEETLPLLEIAKKDQPWLYEVHRLEGDLYRDWARQKGDAGQLEGARANFDKSLAAYARAIDIGESDPQTYKQMSLALILMMNMEMFRKEDLTPLLTRGIQQTDWAISVLPDDGDAWRLRARLFRAMAQNRRLANDTKTTDYLNEAALAAQTANELSDDDSQNNLELSLIYWAWANWLGDNKVDNEVYLNKALSALEKVVDQDRDFLYYYTLGQANKSLAKRQAKAGGAPCALLEQAVSALRRSIALQPHRIESYNSLANCYLTMAQIKICPNRSVRQLQQETVAVLDAAIELSPEHPVLLYQSGRAYQRMASNNMTRGWQIDDALAAKAVSRYRTARAINDKLWFVYNGLGWVTLLRAQNAFETGQDPSAFFEAAAQAFANGLELTPNSRLLGQNMAWVHYYRAKFLVRTGQNAGSALEAAIAQSQRALALSHTIDGLLCLGSSYRMMAEAHFLTRRDPGESLSKAKEIFEQILHKEKDFAEVHRSLGRLHTLEARWYIHQGENPIPAFERAEAALIQAITLQPESIYFLLASARYHLHRSNYFPNLENRPSPSITSGLEIINQVLSLRPGFAEAEALRACLLHRQATSHHPTNATGLTQAKQVLQSALQTNPHLKHEWSALFIP